MKQTHRRSHQLLKTGPCGDLGTHPGEVIDLPARDLQPITSVAGFSTLVAGPRYFLGALTHTGWKDTVADGEEAT